MEQGNRETGKKGKMDKGKKRKWKKGKKEKRKKEEKGERWKREKRGQIEKMLTGDKEKGKRGPIFEAILSENFIVVNKARPLVAYVSERSEPLRARNGKPSAGARMKGA